MDKMKMETENKTLENLAKLKEMFPEVITESKDENGEIVAAVDAKKLEQLLSTKVIEGDECYDFTWVGKKQAMVEACKPIRKTLRPCREESVDWENTQNLYIEGDNLDVLKLLQESYLNKVKMIYIDPPYNTGNDSFIYPDDYSTNKELYDEEVGAIDESGYRMFKNTETNGRFHSSWCSMIYPRLKLARNLLSEDGVIFISIDDNEVDNMKKMCDEVFGEDNFIANIVRVAKTTSFRGNYFAPSKDYILSFAKNINKLPQFCDEVDNKSQFKKIETVGSRIGEYYRDDIAFYLSTLETRPNQRYFIECPDGELVVPPGKTMPESENDGSKATPIEGDGVWRWEVSQYFNKKDLLVFKETTRSPLLNQKGERAKWNIYTKSYLKDKQEKGNIPRDLFEGYLNRNGSEELSAINIPFSFPKPSKLIKYLIKISQADDVILDFFSGSATTAHAVMQLNAEDGGKRKFIMVQLPEICDENSEAYKAGYKNICEIGKERIRRAGKKIVEETGKKDLDIGFRVLKLDSSNMKDVYYAPADYKQTMLEKMTSNIEDGRTAEDLLYACMLEWGLELSLPHKVEKISGFNVHIVNNGDLVACFDDKVSEEAIKQIAEMKPLRAVFRDSSFATDAARVNVSEIFKLKSPNTTIKVL
ncbi:site-specific DNA-methyltransferase [bacterium]|nr:site-specific DNA-methyltransferase [bacterium]